VRYFSAVDERRYLFVTWDGGGNLPPLLALARQMAQDDENVTVFGPPSKRDSIEEAGASFLPNAHGDLALADVDITADFDTFTAHLTSTDMARSVLDAIETVNPQAIVVDCMSFAGLAAAEKADLSTAAFVHTRFGFFTEDARTEIDGWLSGPVDAMRSALGLPALDPSTSVARQSWDRCGTAMSMLVPALESPVEHDSRNLVHVGPIFDEPITPRDKDGEPLVLVSFSTTQMGQGAVLQSVLDAVDGLDARVVCTTGNVAVGDLRAPANATVVPWVSHAEFLPRASAIVTHVGMGTELAALAHGVPLVGMPMGRDQDGNANQVASIGAGLALAPDAAPADIRAALTTVLGDQSFATAARRVARDITQFENGALARSSLGWL
jgi:UDP:flavonoid glycosyltransferase YjiC (YdhE family)